MKISGSMVKALLGYVTSGYFDDHGEPPQSGEDIADAVRNMRSVALASGDLPWFKIALGYLLSDGAAEIGRFGPFSHPMSDNDLRDLFFLIWDGVFPGEPPPAPGEGPAVTFASMSAEDWMDYRATVYGG